MEKNMETELVIDAHGLTKRFAEQTAVNDIDLHVERGKIFGFIGPSGCGKTTTIRMLVGTSQPTEGEAIVLGERPYKFSRANRVRIGYMPQHFVLYPQLTVWENLNFAASLYGVSWRRKKRLYELLELVELAGHEKKPVRKISGGMQRRLSLAASLIHEPELVFLDEPTAGIDPLLRQKFWDYFNILKKEEGTTFFVNTQYVGEAANCDRVGLMFEGRLLLDETPKGLRRYAFNGELIRVRAHEAIPYAVIKELEEDQTLIKGDARVLDRASLELLVDEADRALPMIMNWFEGQGVRLEAANEYQPPYDDVFVKVIEAEQQKQAVLA